jgi:hypothetical protein
MIKQNVGDGLAHPVGLARHEIHFQNEYFQNKMTFKNDHKTYLSLKHQMDKASLVPTNFFNS